jgi:hypothetical protein
MLSFYFKLCAIYFMKKEIRMSHAFILSAATWLPLGIHHTIYGIMPAITTARITVTATMRIVSMTDETAFSFFLNFRFIGKNLSRRYLQRRHLVAARDIDHRDSYIAAADYNERTAAGFNVLCSIPVNGNSRCFGINLHPVPYC